MTPFFRLVATFAVLLTLTVAGTFPAEAKLADPFTVANVPVDVTAASAAIARLQAMSRGQRDAYNILLHRLTRKSDWSSLPKVGDETLQTLVQSIEIGDEHSSPVRYIAKLTVHFHASNVESLLRGENIPFSESAAQPILILPVFTNSAGSVLWSDPNPWRTAWAARAEGQGLLPISVPLGDIEDVSAINAKAALAGDAASLAKIAARYDVGGVAVAVATATASGLTIQVREYGGNTGSSLALTVNGTADPSLFTSAVDQTASALEEAWKQATLLDFSHPAEISVQVPFSSLKGWLATEQELQDTPPIQSINVTAFNRAQAQVTLHYFGTSESLALTLAQRQLKLANQDGYWILQPVTAPPRSPAPPTGGETKAPGAAPVGPPATEPPPAGTPHP